MTPPTAGHLALAFALAAGVALAARAKRALSPSGAVAAAGIGFVVFGWAGGPGAIALLLFFATSTALSRWRKRDKERLGYEKSGGERDAGQVLANGGVAALCALFVPSLLGSGLFGAAFVALLGALAEANADTWATEIGSLAKKPPRLITTFRPAPPGASGAVSWPGTLAALAGAGVVAAVAAFAGAGAGAAGFAAAAGGGFVGALLDSLLGATVQAQYRCPVCGALTERREHCNATATVRARGLAWMNNDAVNALATLAGALIAAGLYAALLRR